MNNLRNAICSYSNRRWLAAGPASTWHQFSGRLTVWQVPRLPSTRQQPGEHFLLGHSLLPNIFCDLLLTNLFHYFLCNYAFSVYLFSALRQVFILTFPECCPVIKGLFAQIWAYQAVINLLMDTFHDPVWLRPQFWHVACRRWLWINSDNELGNQFSCPHQPVTVIRALDGLIILITRSGQAQGMF